MYPSDCEFNTVRSRTNGISNKWDSQPKMSCNFFANKWDFEQMGFSDRKIQGLCENGKILVKKLSNETVLRTKTLRFLKMGIGKTLQLFREQMGFRTNGILEPNSLTQKRKWDPICSRAYCKGINGPPLGFFGITFRVLNRFLMFLGALNAPVVCASNASRIIKKY